MFSLKDCFHIKKILHTISLGIQTNDKKRNLKSGKKFMSYFLHIF